MVTRSNAWWMTKAKGIYIFSASPFRQRAFAGFGREMSNMVRQHWSGALYFASISLGGWYLMKWANSYYHHSISKDPAFYEAEAQKLLSLSPVTPAESPSESQQESQPSD